MPTGRVVAVGLASLTVAILVLGAILMFLVLIIEYHEDAGSCTPSKPGPALLQALLATVAAEFARRAATDVLPLRGAKNVPRGWYVRFGICLVVAVMWIGYLTSVLPVQSANC